jgi:alkylation response protein AidB-like acyl-CoA dehydrogenase
MNFASSPADQAFREEVHQFIAEQSQVFRGKAPPNSYSRQGRELWIRALHNKGWLVPHWSPAWGGRDWPPMRHYILEEEIFLAGCPEADGIGIHLAGPVIQAFGSVAQQRRYLPGILTGAEFWCQGFSEADAGSDLSLVRTTARRDEDQYVVTGHKLWVTQAQIADLMLALVRAKVGGEREQGLSVLLIDMRAKGVSTRPIPTLDGRYHVSEVLLDNVRVGVENLIGEEGKGWAYARTLLENERAASAGIPRAKGDFKRLVELASRAMRHGRPLSDSPLFRLKVAQLESELRALEYLYLRILSSSGRSQRNEALACVLKYRGAEAHQRICRLMLEAIGQRAIEYFPDTAHSSYENAGNDGACPDVDKVVESYLFSRSRTIAAGTTEVQKNMIAALALEL